MNAAPFVWLIVLPLVASPLVYLAGRLFILIPVPAPVGAENRSPAVSPLPFTGKPNPACWIALIALAVTWIVFVLAARDFGMYGAAHYTFGAITLRLDGVSVLLSALVLALGTLVVVFSGPYMAGEAGEEKYYAMLLAMIGAMIGLACAADLFNLWIWFETMAVSSYLLVAFYRGQCASLEAGVKYLVQSATGSVLILLGIALVLGQTGVLGLDAIRTAATKAPVLLAAGALFTIGFGVKIALVPLHTWLPDAHSQAPSGISAMLSGVVIEAGLVALLRALGALSVISWGGLLMGFGALNMLVGNLLALRQNQVKRLLAYSSLGQVGYILLGLGIGIDTGQLAGAEGGYFHLVTHGLMKGLAFLSAGALLYALYSAKGDHSPLKIVDLAGAAKRYPLAALALSVAVLGLGGLPPLAGFMSKWQILVAGVSAQNAVVNGLIVFAALNSVLSLAYYAPLVNMLYRHEASAAVERGARLPPAMRLPLVVLTLAVVAIGVWPGLLHSLTGPAGAALTAAFGR
jgi:proton-translocating NADH-quinone oxidoreductase chain N